jgi:acyl carrier protein
LPNPVARTTRVEPPANDVEAKLAGLWAKTLGVPEVGVDTHLFEELGANSLVALRLASRVGEAFGIHVAVSKLYEHVTVRSLARALGAPAAVIEEAAPEAGSERRRRNFRRFKKEEAP